ncbi:MAG TPA: hypothetical protein VGX25_03765 [Actinophytocola sp.]|uniref:hypothetical protein n=1 Tax=Actinophytocola sp. TaxID=1872138 RepID=UPI002DDD0F90|nr:hypothetical protein [Actinophytocola sp.]HEV2778496.1 hypothetical protein [Actinophytocola sp.]
MTDSTSSGPSGPPWSVDVLADLHAGALDPELSAQLWPRVNADPEARSVIEALDVIKVELGQLGRAAPEPMPAHYAARLDAAIEAEAAARRGSVAPRAVRPPQPPPAAPVIDLAAARRRRKRVMAWGVGVLTAAAAAVAVAIVLFPGADSTGGNAVAARPPLQVDMDNPSAAIGSVRNERDYGPLENQQRLDECIRANDLDPATFQTIGVRQVMMDGKPGIYALLTTGKPGQFRLLIVEPTCGPGKPGTLANTVFPR